MAYVDVLTGHWHGNFKYFTRKQAACIYAAYKRGEVKMTRKQISHMYDVVEDTEADYEVYEEVLSFIFKKRYDLAQAVLDGKSVRMVEHKKTEGIVLTQDMIDNPERYGIRWSELDLFAEPGDVFERVIETTVEWVVD